MTSPNKLFYFSFSFALALALALALAAFVVVDAAGATIFTRAHRTFVYENMLLQKYTHKIKAKKNEKFKNHSETFSISLISIDFTLKANSEEHAKERERE